MGPMLCSAGTCSDISVCRGTGRSLRLRHCLATRRKHRCYSAVVIEPRYSALFNRAHVNGSWLADQLARLEVRYPEVHLVFADSGRFAEDWTYRFLTTALADASDPSGISDLTGTNRSFGPLQHRSTFERVA